MINITTQQGALNCRHGNYRTNFGSTAISPGYRGSSQPQERSFQNNNRFPTPSSISLPRPGFNPARLFRMSNCNAQSGDSLKNFANQNVTGLKTEGYPQTTGGRVCRVCRREAQFLCSRCRDVWYCSQECQVS